MKSTPITPSPPLEMKPPGFKRRLSTKQANPKMKRKPPIVLNASDVPSAAKTTIQAATRIGNEATNKNIRDFKTPTIKSEVAARIGNVS